MDRFAAMPVPAPGETAGDPGWFLATALSRLGNVISRSLEVGARRTGLTGTQISALYFTRFSRPEFATVGNLARILGVSHVTVVRSIRPLIEGGYLRRETGGDRRTTRLVTTELGAETVEVAFRQWHRLLLDLASAMPPEDAGHLAGLLAGLTQELAAGLGMSGFGPCVGCSRLGTSPRTGSAGDSAAPGCSEFDVSMEPDDMNLGCPHFRPLIENLTAAQINNSELQAPR